MRILVPLAAGCLILATACQDPTSLRGFEAESSLVAVQVDGDEVARTGVRGLASGTGFDLFAVLIARRGEEVTYFTEASALEVGGKLVDPERIRRWPEGRRSRVRWFTVEGSPPFTDWSERAELPRFYPLFRPEWGSGWSVPGDVRPRNSNLAFGAESLGPHSFGSARYHVRVEVYAQDRNLTPVGRYQSPAVVDDGAAVDAAASGVVMRLAASLSTPSQVFGLPQVEAMPSDDPASARLSDLIDSGTAFSTRWLLHQTLEDAGIEWQGIEWQPLDLAAPAGGAASWGEQIRTGDVLRVGGRLVFVLRDSVAGDGFVDREGGQNDEIAAPDLHPGALDYSDLCLDFSRGAAVRRLADVFAGGGDVEWGRITGR